MAETSKIEWTDATFNPWRGCTKVSAGCAHCYAETLAKRNPAVLGVWGDKGTRVPAAESYWRQPVRWNTEATKEGKRRRVFCASLADVFESRPELVPWRARLFDLIKATPMLDWLLLTKRPENIAGMLPPDWGDGYPNVWLGTTVENQEAADARVPVLLRVPAVVRFLSVEPMIGSVDLDPLWCDHCGTDEHVRHDPPAQPWCIECDREAGSPGWLDPDGIHWVIVGGESGPGARPMHPDWARAVRDQCVAAGVPFFWKQMGSAAKNAPGDPKGHTEASAPKGLFVREFPGVSP